jgi:class 3 adenylate cyclase
MRELHAGTVTFAFTDSEGSTGLLEELGDEMYGELSRDHRRIVRETFGAAGGAEIDTRGDAFFFSFARARDAVAAVVAAQRKLRDHAWPRGREVRVRMGMGEPAVGDEGYLGMDVVRAARIASAGAGGQILISETMRALLGNTLPAGATVRDLGQHSLKDIQRQHIYEIAVDGRAIGYKPQAARVPSKTSRADQMGSRLEERIHDYSPRSRRRRVHGPSA